MNSYCPECESTFEPGVGVCPRDDTELVPAEAREDPLEGTVLEERYRLETLLGAGGMGKVYRAKQLAVDRDVAVKILRGDLGSDPEVHERFTREAQYISSLSHPNIVQLIDFGRDPELDALYLVMEHVGGRSLAELLADGRLSWEFALEVVYQVCGALLASHDRGMIHRDLKPDNLHVVPVADGTLQVKVLDYGIARRLEQTTRLTDTDAVCGTPAYVSPEQAKGGEIGPQSDLYALGICLYEMLTGQLPFEADTPLQWLFHHASQAPAGLAGRVPEEAPVEELQSLLDMLLAKDQDERPASASEVRSRIEEIRRGADKPVRGLGLDGDWRDRLDELVRPRSEDVESRRLADRKSIDPLAMTAGTLETIHSSDERDASEIDTPAPDDTAAEPGDRAVDRDRGGPGEATDADTGIVAEDQQQSPSASDGSTDDTDAVAEQEQPSPRPSEAPTGDTEVVWRDDQSSPGSSEGPSGDTDRVAEDAQLDPRPPKSGQTLEVDDGERRWGLVLVGLAVVAAGLVAAVVMLRGDDGEPTDESGGAEATVAADDREAVGAAGGDASEASTRDAGRRAESTTSDTAAAGERAGGEARTETGVERAAARGDGDDEEAQPSPATERRGQAAGEETTGSGGRRPADDREPRVGGTGDDRDRGGGKQAAPSSSARDEAGGEPDTETTATDNAAARSENAGDGREDSADETRGTGEPSTSEAQSPDESTTSGGAAGEDSSGKDAEQSVEEMLEDLERDRE